jgi:hypothetical protein
MDKTLYLPSSVRTGGVAVPRRVEDAITREQTQMQREVEFISHRLNHFNRLIKEIDDYLEIVLAKPNTTVEGLKPNYYHIVRMRPGHPAYIKPYEWDDGSFRDLDSGIIDAAIEDDLWNDQVIAERKRIRRRADDAKARDRARQAADRAAEIDARIKSLNNVSISVPRSIA